MGTKAEIPGLYFWAFLLLSVFGAVLLFWLFGDVRELGESLTDHTICKDSNIANSRLKIKISSATIAERQGNKCVTEYATAPKGKENEFIARRLASCWDMYLEGKAPLFDTEDGTYCAFCSVISFEQKTQISGLASYLAQNKVPARSETYLEYLNGATFTKEQLASLSNSNLASIQSFDSSHPQSVIFVMEKNANPGSIIDASNVGATIGGIVLGAGAGLGLCLTGFGCLLAPILVSGAGGGVGYLLGSPYNPDYNARVMLLPYQKDALESLRCTRLEGQDSLEIRK